MLTPQHILEAHFHEISQKMAIGRFWTMGKSQSMRFSALSFLHPQSLSGLDDIKNERKIIIWHKLLMYFWAKSL
jgi:hypothetical protein